jgi:hypothetical protein
MKGYDEKDKAVIDKCRELSFEHCSAYVYLNNCDKAKYGSILKNLNQQHSFQNDQYPKLVSSANSVLSNHTFDNAEALARQRSNQKKQSSDDHKNESRESIVEQHGGSKPETVELSFAQMEGRCYCCGKEGHKSPSCRDKDKPKDEWAIHKLNNKDTSFLNSEESDGNQDDNVSAITNLMVATKRSAKSTKTTKSNKSDGYSTGKTKTNDSFGWNNANVEIFFVQQDMMQDIILLENQSSTRLFCNPKLVANIKSNVGSLSLSTNGDRKEAFLDLAMYGTMKMR